MNIIALLHLFICLNLLSTLIQTISEEEKYLKHVQLITIQKKDEKNVILPCILKNEAFFSLQKD